MTDDTTSNDEKEGYMSPYFYEYFWFVGCGE